MGLFDIFRKTKNKRHIAQEHGIIMEENTPEDKKQRLFKKSSRNIVKFNSSEEWLAYIKENCEIITEGKHRIDEAKVEYQAVTSYLSDMQKIDMITLEQRENLDEAARKIITLSNERNKLQRQSRVLSDRQYKMFERYELQLPKELSLVHDSEAYQEAIQQDMMHLLKEREALDEQQERIVNRQAFLKGIAVTTCIVVLLLFLLFAFFMYYLETRLTAPFLLTVLIGMLSAFYIFMEARKNSANMNLVQSKMNRQIMLMNKVKIKSVNNRSFLDYTCGKYIVENYHQLKISWEEYIRLKDENKRYESNTELLEFFQNELIHELDGFGIADSEIWIYQPTAILDNKEMVEVRHRLNVRRQKLRDCIDMNNTQSEEAVEEIKRVIRLYPDCQEEVERFLRKYHIESVVWPE